MPAAERTSHEQALDLKPGARGRRDRGQEAVIKLEELQNRVPQLIELKKKADEAKQVYTDAIKSTAEQSGLLAATVSRYVKARAGDKFEDEKTKATQLALCFEEITDAGK